jgi:DNA invertase Pin-like site-specific DNA recombinase
MPIVAYARVSTDGQTLEHQIAALKKAGARKVFAEKQSGARSDRPQLKKCIGALGPGDKLLVTRLDRLARSTRDLLNALHQISEKGAAFRSLGDPWADTTSPHGRLMLTVLDGLAEFERSLIIARTGEGRRRAMANGVVFGRPRLLDNFQAKEALRRLKAGEAPSLIARTFRCSSKTIMRLGHRP